jgi:hypothetical protein
MRTVYLSCVNVQGVRQEHAAVDLRRIHARRLRPPVAEGRRLPAAWQDLALRAALGTRAHCHSALRCSVPVGIRHTNENGARTEQYKPMTPLAGDVPARPHARRLAPALAVPLADRRRPRRAGPRWRAAPRAAALFLTPLYISLAIHSPYNANRDREADGAGRGPGTPRQLSRSFSPDAPELGRIGSVSRGSPSGATGAHTVLSPCHLNLKFKLIKYGDDCWKCVSLMEVIWRISMGIRHAP